MRNRLTNELAVCGLNAVLALGEYHPEQINRLFLREDRLNAFSQVCKYLAAKKYPYKLCDDAELERLCKSTHHQGVAAMIEEPSPPPAAEADLDLWAAEGKTGLVLHEVGNDHNLGAMVRAAAFFDAHFVILGGEDQESRISTSAYRVAEGGMEHVTFRTVRSTPAFLRAASKRIVTIGADPRARRRIRDLGGIIEDQRVGSRRPGIALVVGNEETGLSPEIKEQCSALVRIPGTGNIESLNVAQAAALFLHECFEL
ncbi:MAG: RNA methyltransferase [Treponema sp.]|nr:RNA methyltransferase [Treponema sp.]